MTFLIIHLVWLKSQYVQFGLGRVTLKTVFLVCCLPHVCFLSVVRWLSLAQFSAFFLRPLSSHLDSPSINHFTSLCLNLGCQQLSYTPIHSLFSKKLVSPFQRLPPVVSPSPPHSMCGKAPSASSSGSSAQLWLLLRIFPFLSHSSLISPLLVSFAIFLFLPEVDQTLWKLKQEYFTEFEDKLSSQSKYQSGRTKLKQNETIKSQPKNVRGESSPLEIKKKQQGLTVSLG